MYVSAHRLRGSAPAAVLSAPQECARVAPAAANQRTEPKGPEKSADQADTQRYGSPVKLMIINRSAV